MVPSGTGVHLKLEGSVKASIVPTDPTSAKEPPDPARKVANQQRTTTRR